MLKMALLDCAINEKCLQSWRRTGHLPCFFIPTQGDLTAQESPPPHEEPHKVPAQFPVIILPPISCMLAGVRLAVIDSDLHRGVSLRSKRFQSSYSAKFGAGAKKKMEGGGGRGREESSFTPLPLPLHSFFCSRSSFLDELAGNAGNRLLRRLTVLFLGFIPLAAFFTNNNYYFSVIFLLRPPLTPL